MPDLPTKDEIVERIQNDPIQRLRAEEVDGCFRPERELWCEPGDCYCIRQCRSLATETLDALTIDDLLALLRERGVAVERRYQLITGKPYWHVAPIMIEGEPTIYKHIGIEKPDAV